MADTAISSLTDQTSPGLSVQIPINDSGTTKRMTASNAPWIQYIATGPAANSVVKTDATGKVAVETNIMIDSNNNLGISNSASDLGTATTADPTDCFILREATTAPHATEAVSTADLCGMYAADITAGNCCVHFKCEGGATIKMYQQTYVPDYSITWTANEPTAGDSATIADGSSPTVAETGQAIADLTAKLNSVFTILKNNGLMASS